MKRIFIPILLSMAVLGADGPAQPSSEAQAGYWKAWAVYQSYNARFQESLTSAQKALQETMAEKQKDVAAAMTRLAESCGAAGLDSGALTDRGEVRCRPEKEAQK